VSLTSTTSLAESDTASVGEGFLLWRPGLVDYRAALTCQEQQIELRRNGSHDLLMLLEHPLVITLGRSANPAHLLDSPETLRRQGIDCVDTRRGGDVTLHNPGQLVGYPIIDLNAYQRDLHQFLRLIEQVLICTLDDFSLVATTVVGRTGVWIDGRKIASIGVAVRRWISYHGFALNINNDLSAYEAIVPCGLSDATMTSMTCELGRKITVDEVSERLVEHFAGTFRSPYLGRYQE